LLSVLALAAAALPSHAQGGAAPNGSTNAALGKSADAALDKAVATYAGMTTIRATFEQTIENPMTGSSMVSRGEILQRKPNMLSVRFTDPAGDRIVVDGKMVWIYLPSTNPGQVIRQPAAGGAAAMLDPASELLTSPRTRYTITDGGSETLGTRSTRVLTLVPKRELGFAKARVWIDTQNGLLRQFEVTDANGLSRRVRLLSITPNGKVDAAAFRFTPPRGVQVFDQPPL
jgi:outer membrane lipoprotein carrier protein